MALKKNQERIKVRVGDGTLERVEEGRKTFQVMFDVTIDPGIEPEAVVDRLNALLEVALSTPGILDSEWVEFGRVDVGPMETGPWKLSKGSK